MRINAAHLAAKESFRYLLIVFVIIFVLYIFVFRGRKPIREIFAKIAFFSTFANPNIEQMSETTYTYLDKINSPADIKSLSIEELKTLCQEIRQYMIECCAVNPGHL